MLEKLGGVGESASTGEEWEGVEGVQCTLYQTPGLLQEALSE